MNYWITLLIPLLILNIIIRFLQFIIDKETRLDKIAVCIVAGMTQVIGNIIVIMLIAKLGFGEMVLWTTIATIFVTFLHMTFDTKSYDHLRVSYASSFVINWIISSFTLFLMFLIFGVL